MESISNDEPPEDISANQDIKQEEENLTEECHVDSDIKTEEPDNSFEDQHQIDVKEEINPPQDEDTHENVNEILPEKAERDMEGEHEDAIEEGTDIKEEVGEGIVSYDYPQFDDGSMDSSEATALSNVETCLQEEINIKLENANYQLQQSMKKNIKDANVKIENEMTITETHLISNKLINTTSTITNPRDGLNESLTTKTLIMEILPVSNSTDVDEYNKNNPEEILPTTHQDEDDDKMDYDDTFQLNSITGNVLTLEQEAYGLLKAKGKPQNPDAKRHECSKCPKTYRNRKDLKRHMKIHESIETRAMGIVKGLKTRIKNKSKKIKTEVEDKPYKTKASITVVKEESDVKKDGYECTCGNVFQRRSRMETCLRSHNLDSDTNSVYSCMTCSKQFRSKDDLQYHRNRYHRKKFPCKFCPTDYNTRKELFKHLQVHQKVQLMEYKVISEVMEGKEVLKCFMCPKTCGKLSELKSHVMDDHEDPYSCPHCKNQFPKIIDFGNHMKSFHPEVEGQSVLDVLQAFSKLVKAWKCDECGLQFHEADKLALHQIEQHIPDLKCEPQFQCEDCRRVFISQKGLTSHRRIHEVATTTESAEVSEPEQQGVMCLECRKICQDMDALSSHMRLHSPERKYPCKFCDFRFATPEKRKAHAEVHTGDMRFVCFICEYQCSSENRLKHHKESVKHISMKEYLLTGKPLEQDFGKKKKKRRKESDNGGEGASNDDEVMCDICGEKFPNEELMTQHKDTHPFIEFPNDDKPSRIFFK